MFLPYQILEQKLMLFVIGRVKELFCLAEKHGTAINVKKIKFAESSVRVADYLYHQRKWISSKSRLDKINRRVSITEKCVRNESIFGLCQQISNFSDELLFALKPLSPLLKSSNGRLFRKKPSMKQESN